MGKHWASPVQVGVKGRTQRNTFCFGCSNSFKFDLVTESFLRK